MKTESKPPVMAPEREDLSTADLLRQWLYAAVPTDRIITQSLQDCLGALQREMLPLAGHPLGTVLLDPHADRAVLVALKNYGKWLATRPGASPAEYNAALTLYFAAIAATLVFRGEKISTHAYVTLTKAFDSLRTKPWMAAELSDLLTRAGTLCQQRQGRTGRRAG